MTFTNKKLQLFVLATPFLVACGSSARRVELTPGPSAAVISADELRRDLFVFASDSFGGRATATPYAAKAARFLVSRLETLGIQPAGDSGYYQRVPLKRNTLSAVTLHVTTGVTVRQLTIGSDILILSSLGGPALPRLSAAGELVFASYGIQDSTIPRNDLAGLDIAGKTLVVVAGAPPNADSATKARYGSIQSAFTRLGGLIQRQPAAIVLLVADSVYKLAQGQFAQQQLELLADGPAQPANRPRQFPMVTIARVQPGSPFLPADWATNDRSRALTGSRFTAQLREAVDTVATYNVIAKVPGSDPQRRGTYVAFGAHYDHVGTQPPSAENKDTVFNGADDDGSGSVALLAIARAWAQGPKPPRSALFVWHIGEELGLFGSSWFTAHPTVPIDSIVAQINADMIGRNHPDSLYVVGPGAAPNGQSKVIGEVLDSVNTRQTKPFVFNREWDTTEHPERIYYRSDHFNYASKGIPIVFLTTGLHAQYHQLSDEPGLIDYAKLARVATLMSDLGKALAQRDTRPKFVP